MSQHSPPLPVGRASFRMQCVRWLPALLLAVGVGMCPVPSEAAIGLYAISVERDGAPGFNADDAPGHDSSASNGIVRTQDEVVFKVSYISPDMTTDTITLQLPSGMQFRDSATAASVCNQGGALNIDRTELTCTRAPAAMSESFHVEAVVGAIAHGTDIATLGSGVSGHTLSNPAPVRLPANKLRVSAAPRTQVFAIAEQYGRAQNGGVNGRKFRQLVVFGAPLPVGESTVDALKFKGYEALQRPFTLAIKVMPGAIMESCAPTVVCSQPGGAGADILLAFDGSTRTDFHHPVSYPVTGQVNWFAVGPPAVHVDIWTPDVPNFPVGANSMLVTELTGFQVTGLSGAANVSGLPAHDTPGIACGTPGNLQGTRVPSCIALTVDRSIPLNVQDVIGSAVYSPGAFLYGDTHGFAQSAEKLVPGQSFLAMVGRGNSVNSEDNLLYSAGCVAWDPQWLELRSSALLHFVEGSPTFFSIDHVAKQPPQHGSYVIEYFTGTHNNDAERKNFACGTPGVPEANWSASLPADSTRVTAVRYAYEDPDPSGGIPAGASLGLSIPLRRSTHAASLALPTDSRLPWFYQYKDIDPTSPWVASTHDPAGFGSPTGGGIQSVAARVRHAVAVTPAVAPNETATFSIIPRIIGPALAGVDSKAQNVKVKVMFEAQYLGFPPTLRTPAGVSHVEGNAGVDGLWGTADDVLSHVEISLGDIHAPGGVVTGSYQGHMTELTPLSFQLHVKADAPQRRYTFRSVISSDSDSSFEDYTGFVDILTNAAEQDRTETTSLVVSGVASFSVDKSVTAGAVLEDPADPMSGKIITAGEPFTYTIQFANVTTLPTGVSYFVDVLPFNGDGRGTAGLPNALKLLGITAAMGRPQWGTIDIEYTTDAAAAVLAAVKTAGNEHGATGVNWLRFDPAAVAQAATALRFKTSGNLLAGSHGAITVTLRADGDITVIAGVVNDVYGRTMDAVDPKVLAGDAVAKIKAGRAAATLTGRVFNDANGNGRMDAGEFGAGGLSLTITCEADSAACAPGATHTATTDTNGVYEFVNLPAGNWTLALIPSSGWKAIASVPGSVNGSATGTAGVREISSIAITSASSAVNYQFAVRQLAPLTIHKSLTLPVAESAPFAFSFKARCDGVDYVANISDFPNTTSVELKNAAGEYLPVGTQCTVSEEPLPAAPANYVWVAPVVSPAGPVTIVAGGASVTVTNQLHASEVAVTLRLSLDLPDGVNDTFNVAVGMTGDGKRYAATLASGAPAAVQVPVGASCSLDSAMPSAAPVHHRWETPSFVPGAFTTSAGADVSVVVGIRLVSDSVEAIDTIAVPANAPLALMVLSLLLLCVAGRGLLSESA